MEGNGAAGSRCRRAAVRLTVAVAVTVASSGCSSPSRSSAEVVRVTERDFKISIARRNLTPGDYVLSVHNYGPVSHELIVVRSDRADLPLRSDGFTVDEESLAHEEVGALEPGPPGHVRELKVHLTQGRYEVFCNMAGHYFGGMRKNLVVS